MTVFNLVIYGFSVFVFCYRVLLVPFVFCIVNPHLPGSQVCPPVPQAVLSPSRRFTPTRSRVSVFAFAAGAFGVAAKPSGKGGATRPRASSGRQRQAHVSSFDSLRVGVRARCQVRVRLHSPACGGLAPPTPLAEETVSPNPCSFVTCLGIRRGGLWLRSPFSRSCRPFVDSGVPHGSEDGSLSLSL